MAQIAFSPFIKREFLLDISCTTGMFYSKVGHSYFYTKVNNGYGKEKEINWGIEYNLKAALNEPIRVSCRLFFK